MDDANFEEIQEADFSILPMFAVQNIYKYLNYSDIRAASETCRAWRMVAKNDSFYVSHTIVKLKSPFDITEFLKYHQELTTVFKNFYFTKIDPEYLQIFANSCSSIVYELILHEVTMMITELRDILKRFVNLKKFVLSECIIPEKEVITEVIEAMPNVTSLTFEHCGIEEDQFITLLLAFPHLQYLKVSKIFKRFTVSDPILHIKIFIENIFIYLPPSLKELHFIPLPEGNDYFEVEDDRIVTLPHSFNNLKLTKLTFQNSYILSETCLRNLLQTQNNLVYLNLSDSYSLINYNQLFDDIIENLHSIEELILQNCFNIEDDDIMKLSKLKNQLRVLDISDEGVAWALFIDAYGLVSSEGVANGIAASENKCLRELYLEGVEINRDDILQCIKNLPNLKVLNLNADRLDEEMCNIDDTIVEYISNMLPNLRDLNLCGSHLISNNSLFNIKKLKNLHSLDLSKIQNINDETLIHGLKFLCLKRLSLSNCRIKKVGLKALSRNCPSIEYLDLECCTNVDDSTALMIFENFHRLKSLNIRFCGVKDEKVIRTAAKQFSNIKRIQL